MVSESLPQINGLLSKRLYIMKALAILSVLFAHMPMPGFCGVVQTRAGVIGVVVFFTLSGFVFRRKPLLDFWVGKLKSIVLPWLLAATITFVIHCLDDPADFGILNWLLWTIGSRTLYYFVPMLLVCYATFFFFPLSSRGSLILMGVGFASLLLTGTGIINFYQYSAFTTNYLNPLNWLGYFAFGRWLRLNCAFEGFLNNKVVLGLATFALALLIAQPFFDLKCEYWTLYGLAIAAVAVPALYFVSTTPIADVNFFSWIGAQTLPVYLYHIQVAGRVAAISFAFVPWCVFSPIALWILCGAVTLVLCRISASRYWTLVLGLLGINCSAAKIFEKWAKG